MRRQQEINELQQQIAQKQLQISQLQGQILNLKVMIRQGDKPQELDDEELLLNFPDFPGNGSHGNNFNFAIYNAAKEKSATLSSPLDITVGDLVRLTPKELLHQRGFGPKCLKYVKEWMSSHGLQFIEDIKL